MQSLSLAPSSSCKSNGFKLGAARMHDHIYYKMDMLAAAARTYISTFEVEHEQLIYT
jgi:hypothetical protein